MTNVDEEDPAGEGPSATTEVRQESSSDSSASDQGRDDKRERYRGSGRGDRERDRRRRKTDDRGRDRSRSIDRSQDSGRYGKQMERSFSSRGYGTGVRPSTPTGRGGAAQRNSDIADQWHSISAAQHFGGTVNQRHGTPAA